MGVLQGVSYRVAHAVYVCTSVAVAMESKVIHEGTTKAKQRYRNRSVQLILDICADIVALGAK